jgi:hypothetical protein
VKIFSGLFLSSLLILSAYAQFPNINQIEGLDSCSQTILTKHKEYQESLWSVVEMAVIVTPLFVPWVLLYTIPGSSKKVAATYESALAFARPSLHNELINFAINHQFSYEFINKPRFLNRLVQRVTGLDYEDGIEFQNARIRLSRLIIESAVEGQLCFKKRNKKVRLINYGNLVRLMKEKY